MALACGFLAGESHMRQAAILLFLTGAVSAPASAFDWGLQGRAGYTFSDNVAQAPVGDSANILGAEISAALEHASRTLAVDAEANYGYRYFFDDQYRSESLPQVRGSLEWSPLPERFRFAVTDTYGQVALNPAEGLLPSEFENANVLTTGPVFIWPLSIATRIQVAGEYRNATFDESLVDTQRRYGEFRVEHDLTRLISVFSGVSRSRTEFDVEDTESTFDIKSAFLGFDAVGRRSALTFDAGIDSLNDGDESFGGARYDLTYERQMSSDARIFVAATRELADAADVFSLAQISDPALASIRDVQVTSQPLRRSGYRIGYALTGRRLSFDVIAGFREEDFLLMQQDATTLVGVDREIRELVLGAEYVWSPPVRIGARAEFLQEDFVSGVSSDDLLLTFSWLRRITPRFDIEFRTQRIERTNSPQNFEESRYLLYVQYNVRELRVRRNEVFDRAFERRVRRGRGVVGESENSPSGSVRPEAASDQAPPPDDAN